jgi:hypothetical protein
MKNAEVVKMFHLCDVEELAYVVKTGQIPGVVIPAGEAGKMKNKVKVWRSALLEHFPWMFQEGGT